MVEKNTEDEVVYYCDFAEQPDIHIVGIGLDVWTTPAWMEVLVNEPDGVFRAENHMRYTFDESKVTASESLGWLAYMKMKEVSGSSTR